MKHMLIASLLLASFSAGSVCFAEDNSEQKTSDASVNSALESAALPVSLCAAGAIVGSELAVGTGHRLIKLVDAAGEGLGELTVDGLTQIDNVLLVEHKVRGEKKVATPPTVTYDKKEIPLLVRPDYVELNEKVKLK